MKKMMFLGSAALLASVFSANVISAGQPAVAKTEAMLKQERLAKFEAGVQALKKSAKPAKASQKNVAEDEVAVKGPKRDGDDVAGNPD